MERRTDPEVQTELSQMQEAAKGASIPIVRAMFIMGAAVLDWTLGADKPDVGDLIKKIYSEENDT